MRERGPDTRVRKASYYVWFLGAGESTGLRGQECVRPVLSSLLARERTTPPDKVTLQISGRGVRVLNTCEGGAGPSRHFIPAAAITYVQQETRPNDDLVSAVLLLYNPATRCPVHLHAYRCDSVETAGVLRDHLAQLAGRPEHQAKLVALEARLQARGLALPHVSRGSDGASTGSSGSSTGLSGGGGPPTLYDSLAAELREKLNRSNTPLLLPPKDYEGNPPASRSGRKSREEDQITSKSSGIGSENSNHNNNNNNNNTPTPPIIDDDDDWPTYSPSGHPTANGTPVPPRPRSPALRNMSPVRMKRQGPNPHYYRPHRSDSPCSPRERFQDARDKFRSLERWAMPTSPPGPTGHSWDIPAHAQHPNRAVDRRQPRQMSPDRVRDHRRVGYTRYISPERDCTRAKSMHDLSNRRTLDGMTAPGDNRASYEYQDTRSGHGRGHGHEVRRYRSHSTLDRQDSSSSSSSDSYTPIPDGRRFPGLDKVTARPDPLEAPPRPPQPRSRRLYDYPMNGGSSNVHMSRATLPHPAYLTRRGGGVAGIKGNGSSNRY